jgi:peptide/nickel transport system substrate-binding protein
MKKIKADRNASRRAGLSRRQVILGAAFGAASLATSARSGRAAVNEIVVGTVGDVLNFDAYQLADRNYAIQRQFHDFLADYDYQLKATPSALESWTRSADGTSALLQMRRGIMLHSGREWNSADLVQAFTRAANPQEGMQLLGPMASVRSFEAKGPNQVELQFNGTVSESVLTDLLSTMPVTDASRNSIQAVLLRPAGSGPFRLVERAANDHVMAQRTPGYWRQGPKIERLTVKIFDNSDAMVTALESGAIDVANALPPIHAARLAAKFDIHGGYEGALSDMYRFNPINPAYNNVSLRQAFRHAIDRDRIARDVYFGQASPAFLAWVGASPAHDAGAAQRYRFDLEAAAELLRKAGGAKSASIMADGSVETALKAIQIIQSDLKKIGFDLQIDLVDNATFNRRAIAGDYGAFYGKVSNGGKRSPSAITTNSFMRLANNPVWKDQIPQDYLDAMGKVRAAVTADAEQAASRELNAVIDRHCWFVPVVFPRTLTAQRRGVAGVWRDIDDRLDLRGVSAT